MKKVYILGLLMMAFTTLKSQEIRNTAQHGARAYQMAAPEYLPVLPGIEQKDQGANSIKANIDSNAPTVLPITTVGTFVEPDTRTLNTSLPVGTTEGQASVSLSGGATYAIPVFCAPGTAGMQPKLALVYSSQAGNGIAGNGWNISGLSSITRIPHTSYHDGDVKGVDFIDDRFALDGQRLITVSGNYGADLTSYYTEVFNGSKIVSHGSLGGAPVWFEVFTKEGNIIQYGNTDDSRFKSQLANQATVSWNVNKITDLNGNYIQFIYYRGAVEYYLTEIKYTGNDVAVGKLLTPYNSIKFYYSDRTDKSTNYIAGSRIEQNVLLDHIDILAENTVFKTYKLKYYFDIQSKLNEVEEYGKDGNRYNSTVFGYGTKQETFSSETISGLSLTEAFDVFPGDYNGDGYSDILAATYVYISGIKQHTSFKIYRKDPNPANNTFVLSNTTILPAGFTIINKQTYPNLTAFIANDVNGDGQSDITIAKTSIQSYGQKLESLNYYISSSNASVFTLLTPPRVPQQNFYKIKNGGNYIFPGDFDGDGIDDVLTILGNSQDNYSPLMCFGNQTGSCGSVNITGTCHFATSTWQDMDKIYIQDFDGDGKSDIMLIKDNNCEIFSFTPNGYAKEIYYSGFPTKYHWLEFGDFNGDGKTDILCRAGTAISSPWEIDLFTGTSFVGTAFTFNHTPNITGVYSDDKLVIADLNSDGLADIYHEWSYFVGGVSTSSKIDLYYKKTSGFDYKQIIDPNVLGYSSPTALDINGDGRVEVLNRLSYSDPIQVKYFGKNNKANLLERIKNGNNYYTKLSYKRLTEAGTFYSRTAITGYPVNTIQVPFYLVNQIQSENGIGGFSAVSYFYKDALLHKQGKGFLGFKSITSVDPGLIASTNTSTLDATYYFLKPDYSKTVDPTGTLLNESSSVYSFMSIYQAPAKVFYPYQSTVTTKDYFSGTKTINELSVDQYGNSTNTKTSNYPTLSATTPTGYSQTALSNYVNAGSWCPSKPNDVTTTLLRTGEAAFVKTNHYNYNTSNGWLTSTNDFYGTPKETTTTYAYYTNGLLQNISLYTNGIAPRYISYVYDNKSRFVTGTNDPEHLTSAATYDPAFGSKLTNTDANGIIITNTYDGFGAPLKSTNPLGVWGQTEFKWYSATDKPNVLFYSESTSNNAPTARKYFDKLGRALYESHEDAAAQTVLTKTQYNAYGLVISVSEPYFSTTSPTQFTTTTYDNYNRVKTITLPTSVVLTYTNPTPAAPGLTSSITNSATAITTSKTMDALGKVASATDPGGTIVYTYYSHGSPKEITAPDGSKVTMTYDAYGRQASLTDPDAGTITYVYNAHGELTDQTDAKLNHFVMTYDNLGRMLTKTCTNDNSVTTNTYNPYTSANAKGLLNSTTNSNGTATTYTYDNYSRVAHKTVYADQNFNYFYTYDSKGNLDEYTYPSGFVIKNTYNPNNGLLVNVKDKATGKTIYVPGATNARGQVLNYTNSNGTLFTSFDYDTYGFPQFVKAGTSAGGSSIQKLHTIFEPQTGNLLFRDDENIYMNEDYLYESFTYDAVHKNRLASWQVLGQQAYTMTYADNNGNIQTKSDLTSVGNPYIYNATDKPHAVKSITAPLQLPTEALQTVSYNRFNKVQDILNTNQGLRLSITYGTDEQRVKSAFYISNVLNKTKYFIGGDYEVEKMPDGTERRIHYLPGGGMYVSNASGVGTMYYVLTDYQGNWYKVVTETGSLVEQYSFDAWGKRRNPADWSYNGVPASFQFDRGYTGHEMLDAFGLINMNGRVYDPVIARFLSPDNYVQVPDNSQGFNRYSYCLNNPLMYTDRNGNWFGIDDLVAAAIGGIINLGVNAFQGNIHNLGQGLAAFGAGAAAGDLALYGPAGWAAGGAITGATNAWLGGAKGWDIAKGGAMGAISGLAGGAGGALGASASQALGALPGTLVGGLTGSLAGGVAGGLAGGINNSIFGGGSFSDGFWAGFKSGAISGGINGAISGGVKGYSQAKSAGANPWTGKGYVGASRTYSATFAGNKGNYQQPDPTKNCYAYAAAFSNPNDPFPQDYIDVMGGADGASMYTLADNCCVPKSNYGGSVISGSTDFDALGSAYASDYSIFATADSHVVNVTQFTVSDKMNIFFGGTHQVVTNVSGMNSLSGSIVPCGNYMRNGSVLTWIKW